MSVDDLDAAGRPARQAGPGPLRPQRPARRTARITDDGRIRASVPTIRELADAGARVVVTAHLGRPKGAPDPAYSLRPVAARLGELLGADVAFADRHGRASRARRPSTALADGQVAVLENVRFNAGRDQQGRRRARRLRRPARRARRRLRLRRLRRGAPQAGLACTTSRSGCRTPWAAWSPTEIDVLRRLTEDPERPYVVVLGGSKVSDKLGVIDNLLGKADKLLIGGGMVFTFLKAQGHEVGKSLLEEDQLDTCRELPRSGPRSPGVRDPAADRHRGRRRSSSAGRRRPTRRRRRRDPGRPARASTSARSRRRRSPRRWPTRGRCSGTARWASSSSTPSPTAPGPSPRR